MCFSAIGQENKTQDKNFHIFQCFGQSNMEGNAGSPMPTEKV